MFLRPFFLFLLLIIPALLPAQTYQLTSPDGRLRLELSTAPVLTWQLNLQNESITQPAPLALTLAGYGTLGNKPTVLSVLRDSVRQTVQPYIHQKSATIEERYNELIINCKDNWGVAFRAYNEGIAYRFFTNYSDVVTVINETVTLRPAACQTIFFPEEDGFYSHNERIFKSFSPGQIGENNLASLPVLVQSTERAKILLTETDLQDYPGLWVMGTAGKNGNLRGTFPRCPKYTLESSDRDIFVTDREAYLAKTKGTRTYPWRLFLVAEKDADLLTNQMPWLLAESSRIKNTAWIKPGKVAWDWWNNLNLSGVNFQAGVNTASYQYFVDFAAKNNLSYIILDEGWSTPGDLMQVNPAVDMDALAQYARQKNIGLILWATWTSIDHQFEVLLPNLKKWGVKGLKIDFMQRDDQECVNFYWRMAEKAAKNQLLCDFHGAHKPAGLQRTWPNVLSFEGVYGMENCKWDTEKRIGPEHNLTLPFTRQVAGPMDYTPGAMLNSQLSDWAPSWNSPASLGTRCHELAKYVVFESPLQMLADSPTNYTKEPECLQFLAQVPATWEQTVALDGKVSDYIAIARQGENGLWYIGAMTDWTARDLTVRTDFLPEGSYEIEIFADGPNAGRNAQDYRRTVTHLRKGDPLTFKMAPGGGGVAILRKM